MEVSVRCVFTFLLFEISARIEPTYKSYQIQYSVTTLLFVSSKRIIFLQIIGFRKEQKLSDNQLILFPVSQKEHEVAASSGSAAGCW